MPAYDYQCQKCSAIHEHICSVSKRPESITCPRCGGEAEQILLWAPGVATSGKMTQDVAIGRNAEKRWGHLQEKKSQRDKVRRESGKNNLKYEGGKFKPSDKQLQFVNTPEPKD